MDQQHQNQEELLRAWMEMSVYIRGNRILSEFSLNEIMILSYLYQRHLTGNSPMTATELGGYTQLLKSQINRTLTDMEKRGLIRRERATHDKRVVYVHLLESAIPLYLREHRNVLNIVEAVYTALGDEDTKTLTELMRKATAVVNANILKEEN